MTGISAKCVVIIHVHIIRRYIHVTCRNIYIYTYIVVIIIMLSAARVLVPGATDRVNEKTRTSPPRPFPVISAKEVILFDRNGF